MKMAARLLGSLSPLHVAALGADQVAGPGRQRGEGDPVFLVRLLHAGGLEVLQDHLREVCLLRDRRQPRSARRVDQLVVLIHAQHAMRRRLSTVKGPATRTFFLSS